QVNIIVILSFDFFLPATGPIDNTLEGSNFQNKPVSSALKISDNWYWLVMLLICSLYVGNSEIGALPASPCFTYSLILCLSLNPLNQPSDALKSFLLTVAGHCRSSVIHYNG